MYLKVYLKLTRSFSCPNESNKVDIFQCNSLFSAKVPPFVTILPQQQGNTVQGNTKRVFDAKKAVNVADIHLK